METVNEALETLILFARLALSILLLWEEVRKTKPPRE